MNEATIERVAKYLELATKPQDNKPFAWYGDESLNYRDIAIRVIELAEDQWEPIETAPKNDIIELWGEAIGLMMPPSRHPFCRWFQPHLISEMRNEGWQTVEGQKLNPTHWRPIPKPPKT